MTRFEMEISGKLGEFWKKDAEKRLQKINEEIDNGEITFVNRVAYNCIGRVVTDEVAELISYVRPTLINVELTKTFRDEETDKFLAEYRESQKSRTYSEEELFEMRSAFGEGTTVVDIIIGRTITL